MTSITVLGAASGIVTGSSYLVKGEKESFLIDFGAFQGRENEGKNIFPKEIDLKTLTGVIITHGHLDHVGRLPLLIQQGFKGPLYATPATIEMLSIVLRDSAKIQENNRYENPLYTSQDVELLIERCKRLPMHKDFECGRTFSVRAIDSGHMLGSVSFELTDKLNTKKIIFSGDIGPRGIPFLNDFETFHQGDVVFLESTYGNREHKSLKDTLNELAQVVTAAHNERGKVLIPAFAIGRTQQLIYHLAELSRDHKIPRIPIFIDSPMASHANQVYRQYQELFDSHAKEFIASGEFGNYLKTVYTCQSAQDSKALNSFEGACVIIAGSGMCNGGRIIHHLKHHLRKPSTKVVIAGFQAEGTLGRKLVDHAPEVVIQGDYVPVHASVHTLGGLSAHAGQQDLLTWAAPLIAAKAQFALTHGENLQREALREKLLQSGASEVTLPQIGQVITV